MVSCGNLTIAATPTPATFTLDTAITITPPSPVAGSAVTVSGTLRNTGGTSGSQIVYANMGTPAVRMTSQSYTVAAGGVQNVSLSFTVPSVTTAGNYQMCLAFT
jgi:hypothetical protein